MCLFLNVNIIEGYWISPFIKHSINAYMCSIALLILRTSFSHFDIYELLELPYSQQSVCWGPVFAHVSLRLALTQCHELFTVSFAVFSYRHLWCLCLAFHCYFRKFSLWFDPETKHAACRKTQKQNMLHIENHRNNSKVWHQNGCQRLTREVGKEGVH